uniref:Uncharacterized protein n=1 Tax=Panulirus argus virus 1 TaxID=380624 RepID=A0A6G9HE63_9VIRU|nr:hypothetical protein [Panulirus argus virus 1]
MDLLQDNRRKNMVVITALLVQYLLYHKHFSRAAAGNDGPSDVHARIGEAEEEGAKALPQPRDDRLALPQPRDDRLALPQPPQQSLVSVRQKVKSAKKRR